MSKTVKTNAVRLLENAGIVFAAHEYDISDGNIDAQSIAAKLNVEGDRVFKTLVAESPEKEHFVFVVPAIGSLNLKKAAKTAQVDHFVRTLPDGYQMMMNEETTNISQGQKQLLTIARAILADPKILILDEATSSVDTRTEILIQKAMDNLMKGRTSFIIAHRLSTIRNADLILCMNNGDIVEQGNHEELMALGGFYANLYNSQFEKANA